MRRMSARLYKSYNHFYNFTCACADACVVAKTVVRVCATYPTKVCAMCVRRLALLIDPGCPLNSQNLGR